MSEDSKPRLDGEEPDLAPDDFVIHVDFDVGSKRVDLVLRQPDDGRRFSVDLALLEEAPQLSAELDFLHVEQLAEFYKELLRKFKIVPDQPAVNNAFEVLAAEFARSGKRPFEWRISGARPAAGARNPVTLPWELVLYEGREQGLIARAAVVRSLERTNAFAPTTLSEPFRTLLVQGGQSSGVQLRFDKERANLERVWRDLGSNLHARIEAPRICSPARDELEACIRETCPHLLWFSGHGRVATDGFEFLFNGDKNFTPITDVIPAIRNGCRGKALPLVAAFWTCESVRLTPEPQPADNRSADADVHTHEHLPALIDAMTTLGIEAVIGCQTRVLDTCARAMAKALFRNFAEGQGPARALAAARGELVRSAAAGAEAEWPSPVLWAGGARIPILRWARDPGEDAAILLDKLCYESVFKDDAAMAVWQSEPAAATANWIARAPCWVEHPRIDKDSYEMFKSLRHEQSEDRRALLIIQVTGDDTDEFLRAFASNMRELRSRIFPGVELPGSDWLMSIFALADAEKRREDAWRRLLEQQDLVIAVIARAGLTDMALLNEAMRQRFPIVVFSKTPLEPDTAENGAGDDASWSSDVIDGDATLPDWSGAVRALFEALATLNLPLSAAAIDDFGKDFEVERASSLAGAALLGYGGRFVLRAAIADVLTRDLDEPKRRAAHLACLHFLDRNGLDERRPAAVQLGKRLEHAQALGRRADILAIGARAIAAYSGEGNHDGAIRIYRSLKRLRRELPLAQLLDVATAYGLTGRPLLALDILDQVVVEGLWPQQRIDFALRRAEALRNTNDRARRAEALVCLEGALAEAEGLLRERGQDRGIELTVLILRHDIARHRHYFHGKAQEAKREYEDVIAKCADDPDRQYLKVAALRNLGDVSHRYAYGSAGDVEAAIRCFDSARMLATKTPQARGLLAEILYELAKAVARDGQKDLSARRLGEALKTARYDGNALILALATNRRFWADNKDVFNEADWTEWRSVERQLDAVEHHSWAARALVNSRLRAAKRRRAQQPAQAIEVLSQARALLRARDGLRGPSDVAQRWLPVYAGLAVLQKGSSGTGQQNYNPIVWSELARDLPEVADQAKRDPLEIWNAVR